MSGETPEPQSNPNRFLAVLSGLALTACLSAPPPAVDVETALALLREANVTAAEPIPSELLRLAEQRGAAGAEENLAALLNVGADCLSARIHLIRAARESFDFQTFVWAPDDVGQLVYHELLEAARRGVRVRILVDQLGLPGEMDLADVASAHANLELKLYNPLDRSSGLTRKRKFVNAAVRFQRLNHRMHNKVMVADRSVAIVGGRNIQDRYYDVDPEFGYLDRDLLVAGPVVDAIAASFDDYWEHEISVPAEELRDVGWELIEMADEGERPLRTGRAARLDWLLTQASREAIADVLPHSTLHEVDEIHFVADPPTKRAAEGELDAQARMEGFVDQAEEYVIAQSNYLIFTKRTFDRLEARSRDRPEVELHYVTNSLVAGGCDLCFGIARKQKLKMLNLGLQIYELRPLPADVRHYVPRYEELVAESAAAGGEIGDYDEFLVPLAGYGPQYAIHAKSIVIDGRIALVSSHNFDPRSQIHNTEAGLFVVDEELAGELEGELRLLMINENSWRLAKKPYVPVWTQINRTFAACSRWLPLFDLWPWRGYACYDLQPGEEPAEPSEESFHESYRKAGDMPETSGTFKRLRARLTSAFGGFGTNLF